MSKQEQHSAAVEVEDQHCPLCQQMNQCNVTDAINCWCMAADIPKALLAKVPESQRNQACICQTCIERFAIEV